MVLLERDFTALRPIPDEARRAFRRQAGPLSGRGSGSDTDDKDDTKGGGGAAARKTLAEWQAYFAGLKEQTVAPRSIVRPQVGRRHGQPCLRRVCG